MVFWNKKGKTACETCSSEINDKFSFCPYCGSNLLVKENEAKNFGLLGKNDFDNSYSQEESSQGFGFTDKIINSMIKSLTKSIDKQFREMNKEDLRMDNSEIRAFPNGIKIRIGTLPMPQQAQQKKQRKVPQRNLSDAQIEKMTNLPRATAKTSVKRLSDKVVYELNTPGVISPEDVFVSKLETGYEIKAIGAKKVFVNSLPVELPIKRLSLLKDKLVVEFNSELS